MKKVMMMCALVFAAAGIQFANAQSAAPAGYSFGDFKSETLAAKSWQALASKNLDEVLAYTNKCLELYEANAVKMQADLKQYPSGEPQKIFSFWALNDVATCLYIQGEAYRQAKQLDKSKAAFERIIKEFSFGQTYDPANKAFWKPADAAKDKISMMEKGLDLDFGNMSSATLVNRLWDSLAKKDLTLVMAYHAKLVSVYEAKAKEMQLSMKEYAWESPEKIHSFWALNDVGTGYFILGEANRQAGKKEDAIAAFQKIVSDFGFAQCWDPNGWFWKPAEAAEQKLVELGAEVKK
ncbi:MAG: tetratricopeptide repeat protein [Candidatus Omnitrophota bacterium]